MYWRFSSTDSGITKSVKVLESLLDYTLIDDEIMLDVLREGSRFRACFHCIVNKWTNMRAEEEEDNNNKKII